MARKAIRIATKVKDQKTFEQIYKSIDRLILRTYTPHTAWVQTLGKQPRLLRICGAAFSQALQYTDRADPLGLVITSHINPDHAYFLDIVNPTAPQHPMFREDETTGLPVKVTRQKKTTSQAHQSSPTKRKAKSKGKPTGGRPIHKLQTTRGMSLQTYNKVEKSTNNNTRDKSTTRLSDNDEQSSTFSEDIAPSPKRRNQKRTPPTISTVPQRKSTRNRQSALSTSFGNPVPINTISDKNNDGKQKSFRFEIDSPPDKPKTEITRA